MKDTDLMPFGKHKDEKLANVPAYHLLALYDSPKPIWHEGLRQYIEDNIYELREEMQLWKTLSYFYPLNALHQSKEMNFCLKQLG